MRILILLAAFLLVFTQASNAQTNFENGYFITNKKEYVECLIKNSDWRKNPDSFQYKLKAEDEVHRATISEVQEFGVLGQSKYMRALVQVDNSSENLKKLSISPLPEYEEKRVFLRVLVEGDATLYNYVFEFGTRFFSQLRAGEIKPLVHKKYLIGTKIAENKEYLTQLGRIKESTSCDVKLSNKTFYKTGDLRGVFVGLNDCLNTKYEVFKVKRRGLFKVTPKIGVQFINAPREKSVNTGTGFFDHEYRKLATGSTQAVQGGITVEVGLPFNNNKWAILLEPMYNSFKVNYDSKDEVLTYQSIDVSGGIRHRFFLNNTSSIFADGLIAYPINLNSSLNEDIWVKGEGNLAFGVGYQVSGLNVGIRYNLNRKFVNRYADHLGRISSVAVSVGYTFTTKQVGREIMNYEY